MRISIFTKLALTFLIIVAGLVTFLAVSAAGDLDQSFEALVQDREERVAGGIGLEVDLVLSGVESRLNGIVENFDFRNSLVDRLAGSAPQEEFIQRAKELRDISDLYWLWIISPDGILLAAGHDTNAFGNNLLDPPGTYSDSLSKALNGELVRIAGVETIATESKLVAAVFLPITITDRFLGREQVLGVLWGAEEFDDDFLARSADLAGAEIVVTAPGIEPISSFQDDSNQVNPELLEALASQADEISLGNEFYGLATIPFPRSDTEGGHVPVDMHLAIPKSDLLESRSALLKSILFEAAIGGLVAILLAFLIAKSITFPIERLKTAVTALASGDLSRRVEVHSRDEVEDLVKSFNRMADELEANTRRLVEAEKLSAWREVARRLAHEIKNPLSPIKLSIQNLVRVYKGNPKSFENTLVETSETILEEVERLRLLADEFSNFARMPKPVLTPGDICEVLQGTVALFDKPDIGIQIEFRCGDQIPRIMLDRDALSRVFTNLVKNAVEAMENRRGAIKVNAIRMKSGDSVWVKVTIADQGVGMDQELLKQSLNPYFTTKRGGSGLGLAIVHNIVTEHRGRIRIDSEPDKGTVVTLEFPAISPADMKDKRTSDKNT